MTTRTIHTFEALCGALILAVMALAPFLGGENGLIGASALSILALASAALLIWSGRPVQPAALWPFVAFLALLAISSVTTASLHATIQQTLYFAGCAATAMVASSVFREGKWQAASMLTVLGLGLALGVIAVMEYHSHGGTWRVFATFQSPGFFGGYLTLLVPVTLAIFLAVRSPLLVGVAALAWAFECLCLLLTGTRIAIAASAVGVIVLLALGLWSGSLRGKRTVPVLLVAVVLAGVVSIAARAPTESRLRGPAAVEQAHSGPFRVATWKGTLAIIKAHPLLGTGAGTFDLVFPRYRIAGPTRMAHSGYLQIASEAGIPALIVLGIAFASLFATGIRSLRQNGGEIPLVHPNASKLITCGIIAALIGGLIRNIADSDIYNAAIGFTFWALAGLAAGRSGRSDLSFDSAHPSTHAQDGRGHWSTLVRSAVTVLLVGMMVLQYMQMLGQLKFDSAENALQDGHWLDAMSLYRGSVTVDPLRADSWLRLGQLEAVSSDGDPNEWQIGVDDIRKSIRLEPTHAKNIISLGRVFADHGDTKAAIAEFRRAIEVDPHATPAMLAAARLMKGADSERMYRRLIEEESSPSETLKGVPQAVNPDFAWAHYYFGQKYLLEGRPEDAVREFRAAIERLQRRKSYKDYNEAMKEIGLVDPREERELDRLLSDSKAGVARAQSLLKKS